MSKKILAVDDSASIRQMVCFTLQREGYEVIEASDGRDALSKIGASAVNMVITDLHMPNMNGVELIQAPRPNPSFKFTPIVMLTTESHQAKKDMGKPAGATGWIVKHFKPEQQIAAVKRLPG